MEAAPAQHSGGSAGQSEHETNRIRVLANFENPDQLGRFAIESLEGPAVQPSLDSQTFFPTTGNSSLAVVLDCPRRLTTLTEAGENDNWLGPDWSLYNLLLMSVYSPRPIDNLTVQISGGLVPLRSYEKSHIALDKGWNVVKIDLADVADVIPLQSIKGIRWSCPDLTEPVEINLDDIVLMVHERYVFGSADAPEGSMFIKESGRRLHIGAAGRFELVFAKGQIAGWYNLLADPRRIVNLVADCPLGPTPVAIPAAGARGGNPTPTAHAPDWTDLGTKVQTRQRVSNSNHLFVTLSVQWFFSKLGDSTPDAAPFNAWTYTIGATGQVYVSLECTTQHEKWRIDRTGMDVCIRTQDSQETFLHPAYRIDADDGASSATFALIQNRRPYAGDLLFVGHDARQMPYIEPFTGECPQSTCFVAYGHDADQPVSSQAAMLVVWPPDLTPDSARRRAIDYENPAVIAMEQGEPATDDPGDFNHDGFNESSGWYAFRPKSNLVRFRFNTTGAVRFHPRFKIKTEPGQSAWVYIDGRIIRPLAFDSLGSIYFQTPDPIVDHELAIEVVVRE